MVKNVLAFGDNSFWERFGVSVRKDLDFFVYTADKIVEALDVLQTGIGLIEIGAGLAGLGGSGGVEIASFGLGSPVAIPIAAGSLALIADGAVKIGIGISCFKKGNKDNYYDHNLDKQHKGTPKSNIAQNSQAKASRRKIEHEIGRKLTRKEIQELHYAIHGQNYGFWEIVEEGITLFKKY